MKRHETVSHAQHDSYVAVSVYLDDEELYLIEEEVFSTEENFEWNKIKLTYLLASLPETGIEVFVTCAEAVSLGLQLPMLYNGQIIQAIELREKFHRFCDYLEVEYGGAGSQTIRHFIDIHYSWPNR